MISDDEDAYTKLVGAVKAVPTGKTVALRTHVRKQGRLGDHHEARKRKTSQTQSKQKELLAKISEIADKPIRAA